MARYFFHLCDGRDVIMDPDGREIDDPRKIAVLALKEARWCISQDALDGQIDLGQSIEVRDEAGELFHLIRLAEAVTVGTSGAGGT